MPPRERDIVFGPEAARHVLDIRIQTTVFVHYQDARQFPGSFRRTDQIPFDVAVALRGRHGYVFGLNAAVVLRYLLRPSVIRTQAFPDGRGCQAADRELLCTIQETPAIQFAVHVTVE